MSANTNPQGGDDVAMYRWGSCSGCPARVLLVRTKNDRIMPLSKPPEGMKPNVRLEAARNGFMANVVKPGGEGAEWVSHFATCPSAAKYRKTRKPVAPAA